MTQGFAQTRFDLILSSGFLAFARHLGVVEAIRTRGLQIEAIVGTSSGALVGALLQAGVSLSTMGDLLGGRPPLRSMLPHPKPWKALFSTSRVVRILQEHLPERFEQLPRPFAVGVCDAQGGHHLLTRGELIPAVLASMAIPRIFPPVEIGGCSYVDGGVADRVGVEAWRAWRPGRRAIIHVVARSRGRERPFEPRESIVVRTPRTHARFWSLGDFSGQRSEAQGIAEAVLGSEATRDPCSPIAASMNPEHV